MLLQQNKQFDFFKIELPTSNDFVSEGCVHAFPLFT